MPVKLHTLCEGTKCIMHEPGKCRRLVRGKRALRSYNNNNNNKLIIIIIIIIIIIRAQGCWER
jgi:hypothetical protein